MIWHPSPSFGPRRDGLRPTLVVLHYTAMTPAAAALERLCDPDHEVSAHYLIAQDGTLTQMVREEDRAWHAGAGTWRGLGDINSRSIGIEIVNDGETAFAGVQMAVLADVLRGICARWDIAPEGVIGHSDFAPERKFDPGRHFFWDRLAAAGLALGPMSLSGVEALPDRAAVLPDRAAFHARAVAAGYPDVGSDAVFEAFRARFAPERFGPLCAADMADVAAFATLMGVDPRKAEA